MHVTAEEQRWLAGDGGPALAMAMRLVVETGRMLGAERLVPIASAHVDGCLYHGDSGTAFAERLVADGARVRVPTTLNVGALDLLHPDRVTLDPHRRGMARRLMAAYQTLGCRPTWTCAPYQAGHRPACGEHVAWGESNAIVFANAVLGARTERYGDFLDICCALTGRAPLVGLHVDTNRVARVVVDARALSRELVADDAFYPVLGAWLGATVGDVVAAIDGLPRAVTEDQLKALGAAAASTGAVAMFHVVGVTPEAPTLEAAVGDAVPERITVTADMLSAARDALSTVRVADHVDAVAVGSPHLSLAEVDRLLGLLAGRRARLPFYACTGRHVVEVLERGGRLAAIAQAGVTLVVDTCIVVAPILPASGGTLLTSSGKFAHYAPGNIGYDVVYGSLGDCVETAVSGRLTRDETLWR